jgi:pimeloyl-ACP methyl ester carboxylesterase
VYSGAMHDLLRMRPLHARLTTYRGPALLVWGRQDRYVPVRGLASAEDVYPQAGVLQIDRCGHCPALEYPELVAARMRAGGV